MLTLARPFVCSAFLLVTAPQGDSAAPTPASVPVTLDSFARAETDLYLARFVAEGTLGAFTHVREPVPVDAQDVIRMNRDTLYSSAVVDLDAAPATVVLPDAGDRLLSLQVIDQDHFTHAVVYAPGEHTLTREGLGTRYAALLARTFVDPADPADLAAVHALQDRLEIRQASRGSFEVPAWDVDDAARLRAALNALATANGGLDSARMFGARDRVDPVQHLVGTAAGWGGNPPEAAMYAGFVVPQNDGRQAYELTVRDVPVDGFWSVTVYNADGYFEPNELDAYSLNSVTAAQNADGSVTIRFGDCRGGAPNCLPTPPGWNYLVRLYRPRAEILDGTWTFPEARPTP